jgi:hypothetical protein
METVSVTSPAVIPAPPVKGAQPPYLHSATETYSKNVLGPVSFELSGLNVAGSNTLPADPSQSQYIVASNEQFTVSLKIKFNNSPLTKLLLCLGTTVNVNFALEGIGAAAEADVKASITTVKDQFEYVISWTGTPEQAKLTAGLYQIGAVVAIGPGNHPCAQYVYGYGYIERILLQVYPAF